MAGTRAGEGTSLERRQKVSRRSSRSSLGGNHAQHEIFRASCTFEKACYEILCIMHVVGSGSMCLVLLQDDMGLCGVVGYHISLTH